MFAKRLLQRVTNPSCSSACSTQNAKLGNLTQAELDVRIAFHSGIPSTASILAFDPIQSFMAIGTLDGRIKVIGGDNIEGLFVSPKQLPYKNLEFLHNKGFVVSISNANDIQIWNLERRCMACCLHWETNITAFTVIQGSYFMYLGDEYGLMSVLKYSIEEGKLLQLPYHIPASSLSEAAGVSVISHQSIVGIITHPSDPENRVLIAYESGLIVLWDISEGQVLLVRGYKDLQLRDRMVVNSLNGVTNEVTDDIFDHGIENKEISSLCWASLSGSILAVGYIDGDIMLWNMSSTSSTKDRQDAISLSDAVKLQLSSSKRRLPVIVLHWSGNSRSHDNHSGRLFIYGGDEIGSEEVLTILSLECSTGIKSLQCVSRVDLALSGSFADMILIPNDRSTGNNTSDTLCVLSSPGQLHLYDDVILSTLSSEEKKSYIPSVQFPVAIPTVDPSMTVAKMSSIPKGEMFSKALLEIASVTNTGEKPTLNVNKKWPLTGGVSSQLCIPKDKDVKRLYMAGYQDGSVRVWNATHPFLSLIFTLEGKVEAAKVAGASASVSALEFCPLNISLAIGNESGLVRVYKLIGSSDDKSFHFVTKSKDEVHAMHQEKGIQCIAVFSVLESPIRALHYVNCGAKLAVGFECGSVGVFDMTSLSVLFVTDSVSDSRSPVISMTAFSDVHKINSLHSQESRSTEYPSDALFILTKDSHFVAVDSVTGDIIGSRLVHQKKESTATSMHIIECSISVSEISDGMDPDQLPCNSPPQHDHRQINDGMGIAQEEVEIHTSSEITTAGEGVSGSLVLLCCEDALHLSSLESVLKGDNNDIRKVNLLEPCCWTTTFKKKNEKDCGLILLFRTGVVEIRSLPDLEVMEDNTLKSILMWSFNASMDKTTCSSGDGQIMLVSGYELAFISFLSSENEFRIPEYLPCLHDKVLAKTADTAISISSNQKRKQGTAPGILGSIVKGLKGEKERNTLYLTESLVQSYDTQHLESIFSRVPFSYPSEIINDQNFTELNIDDIQIDEPIHVGSSSSHQGKNNKKDKKTERDKLFEGSAADTKPKQRTAEEVKAKYRKAGDAAAAASQARDKLVQRQEKLERLSRHTEELQSGAENFASMANELVKTMEAKKWWNI